MSFLCFPNVGQICSSAVSSEPPFFRVNYTFSAHIVSFAETNNPEVHPPRPLPVSCGHNNIFITGFFLQFSLPYSPDYNLILRRTLNNRYAHKPRWSMNRRRQSFKLYCDVTPYYRHTCRGATKRHKSASSLNLGQSGNCDL